MPNRALAAAVGVSVQALNHHLHRLMAAKQIRCEGVSHRRGAPVMPAPPPVRRQLMARSVRPGLRQPAPVEDRAPSWWLQHPTREGFTQAGEKATEQSRHRKEAAGIGLGSLAKEI